MSMAPVPFRVLLYAHVDLNAVDGSAFFVAGAASLLTAAPGIEVDVVTATPLKRAVVVAEMLHNPQVTVVDPFRDVGLVARRPEYQGMTRMGEQTAAAVLDHYLDRGAYDVVLVRNTEVGDALLRLRPTLGSRLCVYVTGVAFGDRPVDAGLLTRLQHLASGGATLLCQTPEMLEHLAHLLGSGTSPGGLALMSPAVPAERRVAQPADRGPLALVYTGKFAPAWNTVEMLAGFKEAASSTTALRLTVAGDHFKSGPGWPSFAAEVRYLLGSHPDIDWVGGVTREEARSLVSNADVGLGWRHRSLDESLELSTKILENGALGRPTIINPTTMHRRLFGSDYPLFATSMSEYVELLRSVARDRELVQEAAGRVVDVAAAYTYERVFRDVFPVLARASLGGGSGAVTDAGMLADVELLLRSEDRLVEHADRTVSWLVDADDAARILARPLPAGAARAVERFGPFVRWRAHPDGSDPGSVPSAADVPTLRLVVEVLSAHGRDTTAGPQLEAGTGTVTHDSAGRVGLGSVATVPPETVPAPSQVSPDPSSPPRGVSDADSLVSQLSTELAGQVMETTRVRQKYTALSASSLGRAQLAYWRIRARVRRTSRSAPG